MLPEQVLAPYQFTFGVLLLKAKNNNCLFSFCFLIKLIYLLKMSFAHNICCCFIVRNNVNNSIEQSSQLARFLTTFQMSIRWILCESTVEELIVLLTVQEFGLQHHYLLTIKTNCIPAWASGPSEILWYFICSGSPIQDRGFESLRTFGREDEMFRPTRSSEFSCCWVMVSPGCSEKNRLPPIKREVTATHPLWIGAPRVCPLFVFFPCCNCLCIRSFVPCHWNVGLLRLVGLKEYGLGTQSLGLNCPLSEVGTPPPHNSGMAYSLETENNILFQIP